MKFLSWTVVKSSELAKRDAALTEAKRQIEALDKLSKEYQHQVKTLREFKEEEKLKDLIHIDVGDPTPDNPEARKMYIGRVAGFYRDILKAKCVQMISVFHKLLEEETNDRETDLYLKIGIFVCRDLMKWGEQAVGEQISYQTEPPPTPAEVKEEMITQVKL